MPCYNGPVSRAVVVVSAVILGCSGARPAPDPDLPIGGLPASEEPPAGMQEPGALSGGTRTLSAPSRRYETIRIRPAETRDSLAGGPRSLGHRVDLELSRAPIAEAFRFLADAANVNVVLGDDVSGVVTLRLHRVTVRDAIRAVAATQDLSTEWRGNILWVRTAD